MDGDVVDEWIGKIGKIAGILVDGAKETVQERSGGLGAASNIQSSLEDIARKGKDVTTKVVSGVKHGTQIDIDAANRQIDSISHPSTSTVVLSILTSGMASFGFASYFVYQEKGLRRFLRRGVPQDWAAEPADGLIGPVAALHRSFFSDVAAVPVGTNDSGTIESVGDAAKWWQGVSAVTARPTSAKMVYHGMMALCHASAAIIRLRYNKASKAAVVEQSGEANSGVLDVEKVAFDLAVSAKCLLSGTQVKKTPVTASKEVVPSVATATVWGTWLMCGWHTLQFVRCFLVRGAYNPVLNELHTAYDTVSRSVPPVVAKGGEFVVSTFETTVLLGETVALGGSMVRLLVAAPPARLTATAALRLSLLARLVATRHRFRDDTEHTLHSYCCFDRLALYLHAGLLSALAVTRRCEQKTPLNCFLFFTTNVLCIANLFRTLAVFSVPRKAKANNGQHQQPTAGQSVVALLTPQTVSGIFCSNVAVNASFSILRGFSGQMPFHLVLIAILVSVYASTLLRGGRSDAVTSQAGAPPPPPAEGPEGTAIEESTVFVGRPSGEEWDTCDKDEARTTTVPKKVAAAEEQE